MNNMLETKCTFKITVICPYCNCEIRLESNLFVHENLVNVECPECKQDILCQNNYGGVGGVNE